MKSIYKIIGFSLLVFILAACNKGESLTAQEVFEKAKDASDKLETVRTDIAYEESSRTVVPEERSSMKYQIDSDTSFDPLKLHQQIAVQVHDSEQRQINLYKIEDRTFVKDGTENTWDEITPDSLAELFGTLVDRVNPVLDLSLFDEFKDEFELEKIDYGYLLKLTMTREQFNHFKNLLLTVESNEKIDYGFSRIRKLDFEIAIDSNTFYTTDFKMTTDTTTYSTKQIDGNAHRENQKVNATYSHFNNIGEVVVPKEVGDLIAQ